MHLRFFIQSPIQTFVADIPLPWAARSTFSLGTVTKLSAIRSRLHPMCRKDGDGMSDANCAGTYQSDAMFRAVFFRLSDQENLWPSFCGFFGSGEVRVGVTIQERVRNA